MIVDLQKFKASSFFPEETTEWRKEVLNCNMLIVFAINMTFQLSCSCNFSGKIFKLLLIGNNRYVSLYHVT